MRLCFRPRILIGTDITHVPRFLSLEDPDWTRLRKLSKRFMTSSEYDALNSLYNLGKHGQSGAELYENSGAVIAARNHVAGRWAAKEAAMKAWGADLLSPRQLQVGYDQHGRPCIHCFLPQDLNESKDLITSQEARLSISHDGDYATAVVLAEPLHPRLRTAFEQIRSEARANVNGDPKIMTETDED